MANTHPDSIGYCGLCCADCFAHTGTIADLARDLRKELRQARFANTAETLSAVPFFQIFTGYPKCYEVLGALVKFRCRRSCRGGGGNPQCRIRSCCQRKELKGCWQCLEFETCGKLEALAPAHGTAHIRNLRRLKKGGAAGFLKGKRDWFVRPAL